jgi:hypothetical protein
MKMARSPAAGGFSISRLTKSNSLKTAVALLEDKLHSIEPRSEPCLRDCGGLCRIIEWAHMM